MRIERDIGRVLAAPKSQLASDALTLAIGARGAGESFHLFAIMNPRANGGSPLKQRSITFSNLK